MALNDTFIKNSTKHSGKPSGDKYTDGGGMYLLVSTAGKYWRMNYRFGGKRKTLALGVYPAVSLAEARKRRDKAREQLAKDIEQRFHALVAARVIGEHMRRQQLAVAQQVGAWMIRQLKDSVPPGVQEPQRYLRSRTQMRE